MSFSKARLRRFNDIQDYSSLSPPVCCPRYIANISRVAHCKKRLSNDAHHSCSSPSTVSSTTSSSLSYTSSSSNIQLEKNSKYHNQTRRTSCATMPRQKTQNVKLCYKKEKQENSGIWSSSSLCNHSFRKVDSKVRATNVSPSLQLKSSLMLEGSVGFKIISSANEKERQHWLKTINSLQAMVIRMQTSTSKLEDQITELKENRSILELKNQALESTVIGLQCNLVEIDQGYQQKENEKISALTRTIENLKTSEEQQNQNFEALENENKVLCKTMANFVSKILHCIAQESVWKRKEKVYVEVISNLDAIIDENHNLLFETEERLKLLADELESNSRFFDKIRDADTSHQCQSYYV